MNIKSMLLASAAATVAVTGAQAADAIVIAEPEPMEYVRICDAYGAGYFYIPGTETCLRVSGWVRYQIDGSPSVDGTIGVYDDAGDFVVSVGGPVNLNLGARSGLPILDPTDPDFDADAAVEGLLSASETDGFNKYTGAQINFDARSETEYGTLRGWVQLEAGPGAGAINRSAANDIQISINRAVIQLGGLWMGFADSLFSSSSNIGGSALGNYGGFTYADTFGYHYEQRHQIGYQFSGSNGFWGGLSLEHETNDTDDYMPDVVGKVAWSQGWGGAWLAAAYDDSADGAGIRGGVQGSFGALTARLDGYYQSNAEVTYGRNARWAIQGTALYQFNPQLGIAAGVEYRNRLGTNAAIADGLFDIAGALGALPSGAPTGESGMYFSDSHAWAGQLGVNWQPVQNFQIGADVTYNRERYNLVNLDGERLRVNQDNTRFRLRFQRNF